MAFTRSPGPSKNQSSTMEAWGNAEDMSGVVTNISPDKTLFLKMLKEGPDATNVEVSWPLEGLENASKNAHKEKEDYISHPVGSMRSLSNVTQKFIVTGYVTDDQNQVRKVYNGQKELVHQILMASKKMAVDMEFALITNPKIVKRTSSVAPEMGGIPYFMKQDLMSVTPSNSDNKMTTSTPHNLRNGDYVYLKSTTPPTGLKDGQAYYVELDQSLPDTVFYLHNTFKGAVNKVEEDRIDFSTDGSAVNIVTNNIVDLGGKAQYTVDDLNTAMQMAYNRGGNPTMAIMSGSNKRRFSQLVSALATTNRKPGERKMDIVTDVLETDFGTITARAHRMYEDDRIDLLEPQYNKKIWFRRPHQVKDLPKKGNYTEFALEGDLTYQCVQPLANATVLGIKLGK